MCKNASETELSIKKSNFGRKWDINSKLILITIVLSFTKSLKCTSLYFSLKAKIKASACARKTIRETQYNSYDDYFQVFRGFSRKSYPEIPN